MISTEDLTVAARTLSAAAPDLHRPGASLPELAARLGLPTEVHSDPAALVVPLSRPDADPLAQAVEFRRVADVLRAALGEAAFLGAHGHTRPPGRRADPRWGRPFLRWRHGATTLELRAGAAGPELVLEPSATWETWYQSAGTGFLGTREDSGLSVDEPRHEGPGDWDDLHLTLAAFLRTLPAETRALGISHSLPLYGRIAGAGAPMLFCVDSGTRLHLDYTAYLVADAARGEHAAALGWTSRESLPPDHLDGRPAGEAPWRVDAGGPGEVDPGALADLLVRTARAAGVARATDLILGGEAGYRHPYRFAFPSLSLPVG
ncbi:hypothetical protein ACGF1Z_03305 [Streptomyces sp. NPDC048018]|uniref:hypothetical protein n=1 Tax=Streptomyces sp. NPDC048018 TaxID=3365499 RepID=UPI003719654B